MAGRALLAGYHRYVHYTLKSPILFQWFTSIEYINIHMNIWTYIYIYIWYGHRMQMPYLSRFWHAMSTCHICERPVCSWQISLWASNKSLYELELLSSANIRDNDRLFTSLAVSNLYKIPDWSARRRIMGTWCVCLKTLQKSGERQQWFGEMHSIIWMYICNKNTC